MKSSFTKLTKFERIQAAVKIQRAWRAYVDNWKLRANTCPYCYVYECGGVYSQFACREMWDEADLIKLDAYIDRFHN